LFIFLVSSALVNRTNLGRSRR